MRLKALLLTFTLAIGGSSSVALADHDGYQTLRFEDDRFDDEGYYDEDFEDERFDDDRERSYRGAYRFYDRFADQRARRTTWLPLTSSQCLERGADLFDVRSHERFGQVRLQNQTGRTHVRQIEIIYDNGQHQRVEVNRVLDGKRAMINIDLDGDTRRIDKIFIDGRSGRDGSFQLYAM